MWCGRSNRSRRTCWINPRRRRRRARGHGRGKIEQIVCAAERVFWGASVRSPARLRYGGRRWRRPLLPPHCRAIVSLRRTTSACQWRWGRRLRRERERVVVAERIVEEVLFFRDHAGSGCWVIRGGRDQHGGSLARGVVGGLLWRRRHNPRERVIVEIVHSRVRTSKRFELCVVLGRLL